MAIDPLTRFHHPERRFRLALTLERRRDMRKLMALVPVPAQLSRFIRLPERSGKARFLPLEDLLLFHLDVLFPGYEVAGSCTFRILRDSDLEVEEEAEDLVREFETALKRRRRGEAVRLKISTGAPEALQRTIMDELNVKRDDVIEIDGIIGLSSLRELILSERKDLNGHHLRRDPRACPGPDGDMFAAIRQKTCLHHPYETFAWVRFVQGRARSGRFGNPPTLYRHLR